MPAFIRLSSGILLGYTSKVELLAAGFSRRCCRFVFKMFYCSWRMNLGWLRWVNLFSFIVYSAEAIMSLISEPATAAERTKLLSLCIFIKIS